MHREHLLKNLREYKISLKEEELTIQRFVDFVQKTPDCFFRTNTAGHVTGSAFILSEDCSSVLFALHAKLKRWFQLGGHADGCPNLYEVARREAIEESGLIHIVPFQNSEVPIDYDIHEIPANKKEGVHFHYDVRYVFQSKDRNFICSNESLELRWIPFHEIALYAQESATMRAIRKIQKFLS